MPTRHMFALMALIAFFHAGCACPCQKPSSDRSAASTQPAWRNLFDGKTLHGWEISDYYDKKSATVIDGAILIPANAYLNGITCKEPIPHMNYEIEVIAKRVSGGDFFVGLTFPFGETHASLICGGWGGSLVGISSIDGNSANDNETGHSFQFQENRWYRIRLRCTPRMLEAWIDEENVVDFETTEHRIDIRVDVTPSLPFGIATYQTVGAIKSVRVKSF